MKKVLVTEEHSQSRQMLSRLSCFMMPFSHRIRSLSALISNEGRYGEGNL
jgi:hypothetical protein